MMVSPAARAAASTRAVGSSRPGQVEVLAHGVDVAAGAAEVDLPIDEDQRRVAALNGRRTATSTAGVDRTEQCRRSR